MFQEYKRLLRSRASYILLILCVVGFVSIYMSFTEKMMFLNQLQYSNSEDLNKAALTNLINNYTWIKCMFNFWFESDFAQIYMIVLYLWSGLFLSSNLLRHKENGFGNIVCTRSSYRKHALSQVMAQTLYIVTMITVSTVLLCLIAFFFCGSGHSYVALGTYSLSSMQALLVILIQIILISLYTSLINCIAAMSCTFIRNRFCIQALPFLFAFMPMLLSSTVGNLSSTFATIIVYFDPYNVCTSLSNIVHSSMDIRMIVYNMIPIACFALLATLFSTVNIVKDGKNYI